MRIGTFSFCTCQFFYLTKMWPRGVLIAIVVVVPYDIIAAQKPNYCSFDEEYFEYVPKTITVMDRKDKKSGGILSYLNPKNIFSRKTQYEISEKITMVAEKKTRTITTCCRGFVQKNGDCVSRDSLDTVKTSTTSSSIVTIAVSVPPTSPATPSANSEEPPITTPQSIDVNVQVPIDVTVSMSSETSSLTSESSTSSAVQIASSTESLSEVTSSRATQDTISATEKNIQQLPPTLEALTSPVSIKEDSPPQTTFSIILLGNSESSNMDLSSTEGAEMSPGNTMPEINKGLEMTDAVYESSNLENVFTINPNLDNIPLVNNDNRLENEENEISTITIRKDGNFLAMAAPDTNIVIISYIDEIDEETKSPTVEISSNNVNDIGTSTLASPTKNTTIKPNKNPSWIDKLLQILRYLLTSLFSTNLNNPTTAPTVSVPNGRQ